MAGSGRRVFSPGEVLTASNTMNYLMDQAVMNFAGTAARGSAIGTAVAEGMVSYLQDNNFVQVHDGTAWRSVGGVQVVADSAARDSLFPSPLQGDRVFRNDKGFEEQYYALYNASTNVGGATPAGWYPVAGTMPVYQVVKNATTFTPTSGVWFLLNNTAHWTAVEADPTGVITYNGDFTATLTGWYEIYGGLWSDGGTGNNGIMIAKKNTTAAGAGGMVATTSWNGGFNWTNATIARLIKLNAGDYIHFQFITNNPNSMGSNATNREPLHLGMRWVRPAK